MTPTQEWELQEDLNGRLEYQTRITKFQNVTNLTLYFPSNFGNDTTIISYIGLKGDFKELKQAPVVTIYEASPNPADHKTKNENFTSRTIH